MEEFDVKDMGQKENFGLDNSKCALAYRVKFGMIKTLFEIMEESGESDDISDDEFFRMLAEASQEPKGSKFPGAQATLSSIPTRSGKAAARKKRRVGK